MCLVVGSPEKSDVGGSQRQGGGAPPRHRDARRSIASLALSRAPLLYIHVAATGKTSLFDPVAGEEIRRPDAADTYVAIDAL